MFRLINWIHLKYRESLHTFSGSHALSILMNLTPRHYYNYQWPSIDDPGANYQFLKRLGLVKTVPNTEETRTIDTKYVDETTKTAFDLVKPVKRANHFKYHRLFWMIVWILIACSLTVTIHISTKPGTMILTPSQWLILFTFIALSIVFAITAIVSTCKFLKAYYKSHIVFDRTVNRLLDMNSETRK